MAPTARASLLALMAVATFDTTAAAQSRLPAPYQKGGVRFVDVTEGGDVWQIWFAADFHAFL